ncbi:MAG: hypothetical protein EAY65_05620 [Alphaproteobacteria bacterium]|nr:MAG: hypothetical protein EAY65_05620 [Alphaproteobacteria bacterium]
MHLEHKMRTFSRQEIIGNLTVAAIFLLFVHANFTGLTHEFRFSVFLLLIFNSIVIVTVLLRRPAERLSLHPFDIAITVLGSYSTLFLVGITSQDEMLPLQIIGFLGLLFSLTGLLTLRKSFGLLPADRGIVNIGIYRIVRHPIYAGYFVSNICFIVQNFSVRNLICFAIFAVCETLRLLREEKILCQNPDYLSYTQSTRWRIVPFIW